MSESPSQNVLEQIAQKAIEASPDAKLVIDTDGVLVIFNQRAELLFGLSREEVLGKKVEMLIPVSLVDKHIEHRAMFMDDPRVREMGEGRILYGVHRFGKEFLIQIRLAPLVIVGAGIYVLAVIRRASRLVEENAKLATVDNLLAVKNITGAIDAIKELSAGENRSCGGES